MPVEKSNVSVCNELSKCIADGKYDIGSLIIPQEFKKTLLKDGKLISETFAVCGRKIPLENIRSKLFRQHKDFLRLKPESYYENISLEELKVSFNALNENHHIDFSLPLKDLQKKLKMIERTRHLMLWHDGSSLANHGHILFMVSQIFDPALFYTDEEYFQISGKNVNVQAIVEKPELYILARCPGTDEQLAYTDTRLEDLFDLTNCITVDGLEFRDIMRFFKGDGPAAQFEAGQQKGGHYKCCGCEIHIRNVRDYTYSKYLPYLSFDDCRNKVLESERSRMMSLQKTTKLYSDLGRDELISELHE